MIVTELAAFFLAALLPPARRLRALRVKLLTLAVLLVSFECATIYLTQRVLSHGADAHSSLQTRIEQLQDSIKAQRLTATAPRENGSMQSESRFN